MARRTRGRKFTWFPAMGTAAPLEASLNENWSGRDFVLTLGTAGDGPNLVSLVTPITFDRPADPDDVSAADPGVLAGMVGQEYLVERIVGSFFAWVVPQRGPNDDPSFHRAAFLSAGLFVARADDTNPDVPIGGNSAASFTAEYSPGRQEQMREPWMWRRTWVLSNPAYKLFATGQNINVGADTVLIAGPSSTMEYGDMRSGPHVDVKSVRRIRTDERLFLALSARGYPAADAHLRAGVTIRGTFDVRILAALRRAQNRSNF